MSHFMITVALPSEVEASEAALQKSLEEALAPFEEELETPRYVEYTKAELIAKGRKRIEDYRTGLYAEYLADPAGYLEKYSHNAHHCRYISEEFPEKLTWNDDQVYADQLTWYEPEDIGAEGEVYSDRNPNAQWDWYSVGGRWQGKWRFKSKPDYEYLQSHVSWGVNKDEHELATDCGRVDDIAAETIDSAWGYLNLDGKWIEKGKMGWFGFSDADESDEAEAKWKKAYLDWIVSLPKDTWIVNVDCHI